MTQPCNTKGTDVFDNVHKTPLYKLSKDDAERILMQWVANPTSIEQYNVMDREWRVLVSEGQRVSNLCHTGIYRQRRILPPEVKIPWEAIDSNYKYAAVTPDGDVQFESERPMLVYRVTNEKRVAEGWRVHEDSILTCLFPVADSTNWDAGYYERPLSVPGVPDESNETSTKTSRTSQLPSNSSHWAAIEEAEEEENARFRQETLANALKEQIDNILGVNPHSNSPTFKSRRPSIPEEGRSLKELIYGSRKE